MSDVNEIFKNADGKMNKTIGKLKEDLGKIRTGRASTGVLDNVMVDYYGNPTPISQVSTMSIADNNVIVINAWEKDMGAVIDKAIRVADLGLNPISAGNVVRVPMPPLTEERRRELAKSVKAEAEVCKVAVRNIRRDANHDLKEGIKNKTISEDEEHRGESDIQKITDSHIVTIDKLVDEKEKELMSI